MAKVTNPSAKPKRNGSGPKKTGKVTNPASKSTKAKRQIKEVPKPQAEEAPVEEPKVRVMNDDVVQEHVLIRRNVNGIFVAELSRIFTENATTFIEAFLSIFSEEEKAQIVDKIVIKRIEIATYESLAILTGNNSPLKASNKALYGILRDIVRVAEGLDDENVPSEIISLDQYVDQPVYIVLREGAYIFGIDSYINDIRKTNPNLIAMLATDPGQVNEVIANLLLLHMDAWITNIKDYKFITNEKIGEFIGNIWNFVSSIAAGAMTNTSKILMTTPNTDLHSIVQTTNNPDFTIQTFFSFRGVSILQVVDDALTVEKSESIEELLAGDGTEEDDKTLMDVINEE